jgi:hypothetical protein
MVGFRGLDGQPGSHTDHLVELSARQELLRPGGKPSHHSIRVEPAACEMSEALLAFGRELTLADPRQRARGNDTDSSGRVEDGLAASAFGLEKLNALKESTSPFRLDSRR